jgi:hypothetical protein
MAHPMSPFERVRILLNYADGGTEYLPTMDRWYAEWLMANELAAGIYKGRHVASAIIVTI